MLISTTLKEKKKKDFLKARRPNFALWWDNSLDQIQSLNLLLKLQQRQSKLLPRLDFHPVKCTCPSEICSWLKWKAEDYSSCQCNLIPIHNFKRCSCRTAPNPTKINGNFSSDTSPCLGLVSLYEAVTVRPDTINCITFLDWYAYLSFLLTHFLFDNSDYRFINLNSILNWICSAHVL